MKKLYSIYFIISLVTTEVFAQQANQCRAALENKTSINQFNHPAVDAPGSPKVLQPATLGLIGTTTYDLQTNASSCNRMSFSNGKVVATWNWSNSFTSPFPDRGTGYNFFNGTNW